MSLDVAYSIEAQDYLDPDRAYDLNWSGIITDKKNSYALVLAAWPKLRALTWMKTFKT